MNCPVLFTIFNRPETTVKVFEAIRKAEPKQLFVAADGPRRNKQGEAQLCAQAKEIATNVDWDCQLYTLFREDNLGCGQAVSSAIDWFFENVEQGIILEDDTLPNQSFFDFCSQLLERYKDNIQIGQINGSNFQFGKKWGKASYYFSNYPMIWGWGTWRRAWCLYEYKMYSWPQVKNDPGFWKVANTQDERKYWQNIFNNKFLDFQDRNKKIDTWDYQWYYSFWKNNFISITPNFNLISNIGFGETATHTKGQSLVSFLPTYQLNSIIHPNSFSIIHKADAKVYKNYFVPPLLFINRIRNILYKNLPEIGFFLRRMKRYFFSTANNQFKN